VGLGWAGGAGAAMLARRRRRDYLGRRDVLAGDTPTAAAAAWLAERYELPSACFWSRRGRRLSVLLRLPGTAPGPGPAAQAGGAVLRGESVRVPGAGWEPGSLWGQYWPHTRRRGGRAWPDKTGMQPISVSVSGTAGAAALWRLPWSGWAADCWAKGAGNSSLCVRPRRTAPHSLGRGRESPDARDRAGHPVPHRSGARPGRLARPLRPLGH
jgi:hypothetical protein